MKKAQGCCFEEQIGPGMKDYFHCQIGKVGYLVTDPADPCWSVDIEGHGMPVRLLVALAALA